MPENLSEIVILTLLIDNVYLHLNIGDFGISSDWEAGSLRKTVIGTPYYLAPEVLKDQGYDAKADIWAVGISAIEMAEKDPPMADLHPMRVLMLLASNPAPKLTHEEHWSPEFNDFIKQCLQIAPVSRPSAAELLSHSFLKKANIAKLDPLIQAAVDAIAKHGGLEKAIEAMKPKPEEENDTHQDAVDADMNEDMMEGSGALLDLDSSHGSTSGSLAIGSDDDDDDDDDEEEDDFFGDLESKSEEGSDAGSEDDLDIDDILADLGDEKSKKKKDKTPAKKALQVEAKPAGVADAKKKSIDLNLDLSDLLDDNSTSIASDLDKELEASIKSVRTPHTKRDLKREESNNKLKIKLDANGQIFAAPPLSHRDTHREDSSAIAPTATASASIPPEIDWAGLEADAAADLAAEAQLKSERIPQAGSAAEASSSAASVAAPAGAKVEKNASEIDWSKAMERLKEESKTKVTAHQRSSTSGSHSSGNYDELLAELDTMGRRGSTPDRERHQEVSLVHRAFEKEFPLATPTGMKGDWVGRFEGYNPFRNNPQFVMTIEKPTQVLVTLRQTKANAPIRPIAFHVFQVRNIAHSFPELPSYGAVISCEFSPVRYQCAAGLLDDHEMKYVIVPQVNDLTFGEQCSFELGIKAANPLSNPKITLVPTLHTTLARGAWTPETSGGSAAFPSWRINQQFHLKVYQPMDLHLYLTQHSGAPEFLGCYIVRSDDGRHVMHLSRKRLINNDLKFRKRLEIASGRLQLTPGSYIIIPATYEPGIHMNFTLSLLTQADQRDYTLDLVRVPFMKAFDGEWAAGTAGGCMNHGSWIRNPKYALTVTTPSNISFVLGLPPTLASSSSAHGSSAAPTAAPSSTLAPTSPRSQHDDPFVGFYLFRGNITNAARLTRKDLVGRTKHFTDSRDVLESIQLEPGAYVLVPCTYQPNVHAKYHIQIHADFPLDSCHLIEEAFVSIEGEWKGPSAGGSFSVPSWRLNPQYVLSSPKDSTVVVSIEQKAAASIDTLPYIGVAIVKPSLASIVGASGGAAPSSAPVTPSTITSKLFHMTPTEVVHITQFSNVLRSASIPISLNPRTPLVLIPMTMQPNTETSFKLSVNSAEAKLIPLPDTLVAKVVQGAWSKANQTAGGCMNNRETWLQNPRYRFATKKPGLLRFVLHQQPPTPATPGAAAPATPPAGFYIFKSPPGQTSFTKADFIGKSDFASTKEVRAEFQFEVGIYCIILTKFEPGAEGTFALHMFAPHADFAIGAMK